MSDPCPLYPQKRTFVTATGMSALCQKRTHALQQFCCYSITWSALGGYAGRILEGGSRLILRDIISSTVLTHMIGNRLRWLLKLRATLLRLRGYPMFAVVTGKRTASRPKLSDSRP
jgi:hypothetical protein